MTTKDAAEKTVRDIRRKTRKQYSAEEKIRIVLEVLRGEESISALCRRITSPAIVVIKAANEIKDKTTAPNQLWQTDFTYFKVVGWGAPGNDVSEGALRRGFTCRRSWMTCQGACRGGGLAAGMSSYEVPLSNPTVIILLMGGSSRLRLNTTVVWHSDAGGGSRPHHHVRIIGVICIRPRPRAVWLPT